jgi:hypothetical protein
LVILLGRQEGCRADEVAALILANLDATTDDLDAGALVALDQGRVRVRNLAVQPED